MPQKPLKKQGKAVAAKRQSAANKHGKSQASTKKGRLNIAPKRASTKRSHDEALKLTKAINMDNEQLVAGLASKAGGRLTLFQAPVNATAHANKAKKAATRLPK